LNELKHQDLFTRMPHSDEKHRHECEVRWIATLVLPERRKHLDIVEQKRGLKARKHIEKGLKELWLKR
jgi:hypothetical protein